MTLALAAVLFALPASAQDDRHTVLARELFDEGNALMRQHEYAEASQRFERALSLRPTAHIRYNLAAALAQSGELVRAADLLRAIGGDPLAAPDVRAAARERVTELEPRIARLTIRIEGHVGRARIYLDRRPIELSALDAELLVDPGRHSITVRDGHEVLFSHEIDLAEGERSVAMIELEGRDAASSVLGDPRASPDDDTIFEEWWFWTIGAVLIVGGATAVIAATASGDRDPYPASLGTIPIP